MLTVVDAANLLGDYARVDLLAACGQARRDRDTRHVVHLLVEQIEFADVIVIGKTDLVSRQHADLVRAVVRRLNPGAAIVEAQHGRVPLELIFDSGRFDFARTRKRAGWAKELAGEHVPEVEAYGFSNFVWRARAPLHPQRFWDFLGSAHTRVLRMKGWFWLASRPAWVGAVSDAGRIVKLEQAGTWWAAIPRAHWPGDARVRAAINAYRERPYGDRNQEIVFIGKTSIGRASKRRCGHVC